MEMPRNILGCVFADKVIKDGETVGISTSRCYSYYFREMLSLCVLDVALCAPGSEVTVVWGRPGMPQKQIRATSRLRRTSVIIAASMLLSSLDESYQN